ncbi:MAG: hypothetical protein ACOZNI_28325 [Myxococcota bacterium]
MKRWLPWVLAGIVGIAVAVLLFGPGLGGGEDAPAEVAKAEKPRKKRTSGAERETLTAEERVLEARENPPPPPGTLRPMNQAEIELAARLERPFNKHYAYTQSWWMKAAQLTAKHDPALAAEVAEMERILRDQSNLNDGEADLAGTLQKELDLVRKVKAADLGDPELDRVLGYIEQSAGVALQGGDPSTVPKPPKL